jgi:hypothetical protein
MAFLHRNLIDADGFGSGVASAPHLFAHVLFVEFLDRIPVKLEVERDILDGGGAASASDMEGEPFRVERIVRKEVKSLSLHMAADGAINAPYLNIEIDAGISARKITDPARLSVIPCERDMAA